jgi:hypothetical protein
MLGSNDTISPQDVRKSNHPALRYERGFPIANKNLAANDRDLALIDRQPPRN